MSHLHVFTCHKRAYVIFGLLDFGFVLHKKLIISYVRIRRISLVKRIEYRVLRILGFAGHLEYSKLKMDDL